MRACVRSSQPSRWCWYVGDRLPQQRGSELRRLIVARKRSWRSSARVARRHARKEADMCRVAITFGMIAAVALVSPAGGAIPLSHDFFHEPAPSTPLVNFDMIGNLRHDSGSIVDDVLENSASPS